MTPENEKIEYPCGWCGHDCRLQAKRKIRECPRCFNILPKFDTDDVQPVHWNLAFQHLKNTSSQFEGFP